MRDREGDITDRRRFLKTVAVAGSSLAGTAVVPNLVTETSAIATPAPEPKIVETCATLEAPISRSISPDQIKPLEFPSDQPLQGLPGSQPLTWTGDLSIKMMDGAHRYAERKISESVRTRQKHWSRDRSSHQAYEKSVEPNRRRFTQKIGVVDTRMPPAMERFGEDMAVGLVSETAIYNVYQVRWPVLENVLGLGSVHGDGLMLQPKRGPVAHVVALPDADHTPEQLAGLAPGVEEDAQFARRLAEQGCLVVIPTVIDRSSHWSGHHEIGMTDQTHREWIYRQAFQMGRHIVGYEVQKVLAAVDWLQSQGEGVRIGVAGYGEGAVIAFY